jgi:hypothetical protein
MDFLDFIPKTKYTVPSTHFSIYKDTFSFYKDTKCVKNKLILMPTTSYFQLGKHSRGHIKAQKYLSRGGPDLESSIK